MKNFLLVLALGLAIVATIVSIGAATDAFRAEKTYVDSATVLEMCENHVNPSFSTVGEVVQFRNALIQKAAIDSVLRTMKEKVLVDVSTVCLKKKPKIHLLDISNELYEHQDVYLNLPDTPAPTNTTTMNTEAAGEITVTTTDGSKPNPTPMSRTVYYRDTTINGTPVTLKVTEETYGK